MADRVIQRNDTAANWQSVNPVLATGEIGIVIDGAKGYKIGDGVTPWNDLPYPANPTNVVQELGSDENAVVSQKCVTDKLTELGQKLNNSNPQIYQNSLNAQVGGNLFNKNASGIIKDRIFYDIHNDKYKENTGYNISEFISVVPNEIYSIDSRVAIKGYNKDMVFIATLTLDGTKIVIPNDIYWIRFSYYGGWGDKVYVNQGDVASPIFQFGKIPTEKLKDGSVTKEKLATELKDEIEDTTAKIKKVENKYILHNNTINVQGAGNIFNDAASGILVNKYFKDNYGNIADREKYNVSDYMAVIPNQKYITSVGITIHCYDINYNHIGIVSASEKVFTTPENAFWIRFSYYQTWYVWVLLEGKEVLSKKYGIIRTDKIENNAITHEKLSEDLQSKLGSIVGSGVKRGSFIHRGTLSSGEMFEFPKNSISVGEYITFSAIINGNFNSLYVGHGRTTGAYLKITPDEVIAYSHVTSPVSEKVFQHGLTIENNIQVLIEKSKNSTTKLKISSNGKSYSFSYPSWYGNKGTPFVESEGSELKDCSFGWTCKCINSDIWAFGDSYFGVTGTIRWMAYLIADNHTNLVVNGFGGQASVSAYTDLTNLLTIGTPKKILWCLGMNDADSSTAVNANWLDTYNSLKSICDINNIELVLATIPTVPSRIHKFKNEIIRSSGYRYIDFDKAVGASEDTGAWYSDMLYSDGVHPSETGALALYHQAIADMPELLNC